MKWTLDGVECKRCGAVLKCLTVPFPFTGEWQTLKPNYCPKCGASFEKGKQNEKG